MNKIKKSAWSIFKADLTRRIYNSSFSFLIASHKKEQFLFRSIILGSLYLNQMLSIISLPYNCIFFKESNSLFLPDLLTRSKWNKFKKINSILTKNGTYYLEPTDEDYLFEYGRDSKLITKVKCRHFFQQNITPQISKSVKKWNTFMRLRRDL